MFRYVTEFRQNFTAPRLSSYTTCLLRKGIDRTQAVLASAAIPFPVSATSGKLLPPTSIGGAAAIEEEP